MVKALERVWPELKYGPGTGTRGVFTLMNLDEPLDDVHTEKLKRELKVTPHVPIHFAMIFDNNTK